MKTKKLVRLLGAAGLTLLLFSAGCGPVALFAGVGIGYGVSQYVDGGLVADVDRDLPVVYQAARQSIAEQGVKKVVGKMGKLDGELTGYTAGGRKLTMMFKRLEEQHTEVVIRVGFFGDRRMSDQILAGVATKLRQGGAARASRVPEGMVLPPKQKPAAASPPPRGGEPPLKTVRL